MIGEIKYVIPNDAPVPTGDTIGASTIANWFGSDIQYSRETLTEWINVIDEVACGNRKSGYQGTGNTHSVMAIGESVYIECEYIDEQKVFLTREQLKNAIEEYNNFLRSDYKNSSQIPASFIVEYEAEGEEALQLYLKTGGSLGA